MSRLPAPAVRLAALSLAALLAASATLVADTRAHLTVNATVSTRTRLTVSSRVLDFEVASNQATTTTAIAFSAAARTRVGSEVILTVETERWLEGPGGAADVDAAVTYAGDADGTLVGELRPRTPSVAARWIGSGERGGRLLFTLHTGAPGSYRMPLRLVLSAP